MKKLRKYDKLIYLGMVGSWVKVRDPLSLLTGFVHYSYVGLIE